MRSTRLLRAVAFAFCICCFCVAYAPSAAAGQERESSLGKIKRASSVFVDCSACPRALAKAGTTAERELTDWRRFRIVSDVRQADLVFLFGGNPYLGDYATRKGPDRRVVRIDATFLSVVDPHTGQELWGDSREWGSLRVAAATRSLIDALRRELESEARRWTVGDVFRCSGAAAYQAFAFLTPDAALAKGGAGVHSAEGDSAGLRISSADAPDFCRRAQLFTGADGRIAGFEVAASESDALDVADVLEQADRFQFTSGRDPRTQRVFFTAQTRDRSVTIEFEALGHRMVLTRVRYAY